MIPLFLAAFAAMAGWAIGRGTKSKEETIASGADSPSGMVWVPPNSATGVPGHYERVRANVVAQAAQSPVYIVQQLIAQRMPVSPGLAQAAYQEAMSVGDVVTAQQIALVFFPPPPPMMPPPPQYQISGEDESAALQETYGDMEPAKATSTTIHHSPSPSQAAVQDVSPDEWREFLLCFKTRDPGYRGERHIGAFEQSARRLSQLGIDPSGLTSEESQLQALDKDLNNYLQSSERLLNDFTGESVTVNGEKVSVTRSGILALLKAAGPAGAKGWLTEEHQRKAFPHTTEIFTRGNGRF